MWTTSILLHLFGLSLQDLLLQLLYLVSYMQTQTYSKKKLEHYLNSGTSVMIDKLIGPITGLLDKFIEDKDQKSSLAHEIATMSQKHAQEIALAQISVNTQEAKGNWFQSSWRPATAWVCVCGFMVNFLISPLAAPFGIIVPQADTSVMLPVLMGMLGLGTMRSFEKTKGVSK